jgi:hypothetical protein
MRPRFRTVPFLSLLPLLALPLGLEGQEGRPGRMGPGRAPMPAGVERILERGEALGLTPEQIERLEAVKQEWAAASGPAREAMERHAQELRELRRKQAEEVRSVLTPEQMEALRGPRGPRGPRGRRWGG